MVDGAALTAAASRWRVLLAFAVLGSSLALIWREDWPWAAVTAVLVLLPVAVKVHARWMEAAALLREVGQQDGKHRKPGGDPT